MYANEPIPEALQLDRRCGEGFPSVFEIGQLALVPESLAREPEGCQQRAQGNRQGKGRTGAHPRRLQNIALEYG